MPITVSEERAVTLTCVNEWFKPLPIRAEHHLKTVVRTNRTATARIPDDVRKLKKRLVQDHRVLRPWGTHPLRKKITTRKKRLFLSVPNAWERLPVVPSAGHSITSTTNHDGWRGNGSKCRDTSRHAAERE